MYEVAEDHGYPDISHLWIGGGHMLNQLGESADLIRTVFTGVAVLVSFSSLTFSWLSWRQTHRPIVCCVVKTHSGGNSAVTYDLVVRNTGDRPATNIRLSIVEADLLSIVAEDVDRDVDMNRTLSSVLRCFDRKMMIPVLENGESVSNGFGYSKGDCGSFWKYGSYLPIRIDYKDLNGRKFSSRQQLRIWDSDGFAGGYWSEV